jgi:glycine betaine transporter
MGRLKCWINRLLGDVGIVFYLSILLIAGFLTAAAVDPDGTKRLAQQALDSTTNNFGWLYLLTSSGFVLFTLGLAFSRFGSIRLGPDDGPPEFSFSSWLAMIFSGGMGVGLVFWGVAEPMLHLSSPPLGIGTPGSVEAAQMGMRYAFFHWGLHQWANFTVVGLAIAYVRFRHNSRGLISETFRPLLGDRVDRGWGHAIDILAVLSTIFGVATTLGLGALQINSGLSRLSGVSYGITPQLLIIAGLGSLFILSAMTPLNRGIRTLSNANMVLAAGLLLFVLILGPTAFIFSELTQTMGEYLGNIIQMSLVTTPYSSEKWVQEWTIFYWAWGLSWAPFVGSFIARISQGRSIREFVLGVMVVPVILSMLWFSTFGGSAIYFELFENAGIAEAVTQEVPAGLYAMLDQLPGGYYAAIAAVLLVSMFVVTSADSATFVLGMFTSKGGLIGLRTVSIVTAFPFMLLMVLMAYSLYRDLSLEWQRREEKDKLLHGRIESLLLRESEREAARQAEEDVHPTAPETSELELEDAGDPQSSEAHLEGKSD